MPRIVIFKGDGVGRDHMLGPAPCVIGRGPGADFTLEDHLASRRHLQIVQDAGRYLVEDLGSTNGTHLNGERIKRQPLRDGDKIRVGETILSFVQKDLFGGTASSMLNAPVRRSRRNRR